MCLGVHVVLSVDTAEGPWAGDGQRVQIDVTRLERVVQTVVSSTGDFMLSAYFVRSVPPSVCF